MSQTDNQLDAQLQLESKGYTLQEAYHKIGGMGKLNNSNHLFIGKFHIFSSAMLIMGFMSGSFLG